MIYKCNNVTNHYMSALTSSVPVKCRADLSGWSGPRSWNLAGNISPDCIIVATIHKHSMSNYWITGSVSNGSVEGKLLGVDGDI